MNATAPTDPATADAAKSGAAADGTGGASNVSATAKPAVGEGMVPGVFSYTLPDRGGLTTATYR